MKGANEVLAVKAINGCFNFAIFELSIITYVPSAKDVQIGRIYRNIVFESYKQTLVRVERFNVIEFPNQIVTNRGRPFFEFFTAGKLSNDFFARNTLKHLLQLTGFFKFVVGIKNLVGDIYFGRG